MFAAPTIQTEDVHQRAPVGRATHNELNRRRAIALTACFIAVACRPGTPTGTEATSETTLEVTGSTTQGAEPSSSETNSSTKISLENVRAECIDCPHEAPPPPWLSTWPLGEGRYLIIHKNYHYTCFSEGLEITMTVIDTEITMVYSPKGPSCDCPCDYIVNYEIAGLSKGTWTIFAEGESTEINVP